ncbi:cupin domain-containing protein [Rhodobacteraceae bacterium RKSG542]|uniref:cupin domain-containing protein n=1 Tax=Pseudovibrio flavus TaxID=2529854 RepID=UPI0012BB9C3D|nr:cupin domain-containing protein [Pseudovibrio flavus]MTI18175.1 cupin domain-containing protein [Pseudovibrio flavus]
MFIYESDRTAKDIGGGMKREIVAHSDKSMTVKIYFEEGAVGPIHSHEHEQTSFVLSGIFDFTIDGVTKRVKAGDAMFKASNVPHGCTCVEKGVLLDTFTPCRDDYL